MSSQQEKYQVIDLDSYEIDSLETNQIWTHFLRRAIYEAEKANYTKGIWDVALGKYFSIDEIQDILLFVSLHDARSHFYYRNFTICALIMTEEERSVEIKHLVDYLPVASIAGYHYPTSRMSLTFQAISEAIWTRFRSPMISEVFQSVEALNEEIYEKNLSFLDNAFPDWNYDDTWMVEAVYTDANHRKRGLAEQLLKWHFEKALKKDHSRTLINCSIGNVSARSLYEKVGYRLIGEGDSQACAAAMGYSGFAVFEKILS